MRWFAAMFVLVCVAAGCGGSSRLSASAYRTRIATLSHEADAAQGRVEKGLNAKSVARIRSLLTAFASDSDRLGDEVAALKPPKDAAAANAELARGEHDTATATRTAVAQLAKFKTPAAALQYLQHSLGNAKGAHELDDAIAKLKKLGYTSGS